MAVRLQILVGKLNDCANKASDNEVSQILLKMQGAFEKLPDSLFGDMEWKGDTDGWVAKAYSNVINLIQVVEDVIDSYSFLVSERRCGFIVSSNNEMREISVKMHNFLHEKQEFWSWILVFIRDTPSYFLDLLKEFSEKVCREFDELVRDLWRNSKQPELKDNEMVLEPTNGMGKSRRSAQLPRHGQNHTARKEAAKFSQLEISTSSLFRGREHTSFDGEKWPSEHNFTAKLSDGWENTTFHLDQRLVGREDELENLELLCAQKESIPLAVVVTGVAGIGKTSVVETVYKKVKRQFDCYAWVDMFGKSTSDVFRDMLNLFGKKKYLSGPRNASTMADEGSLRKMFSSFLTGKNFLLVLDDIYSEAEWISVKKALPWNNCNGKVVLTSRLLNFSGCRNIKLERLNAEDSYNLLFKQHQPKSSEKLTAEEISKLCKGNPLTITILRSMISLEKPSSLVELHVKLNSVRSSKKKNEAASTNTKQKGDHANEFIPLCYSALRPMLKSCFLYGALFPPHSKIPCRKLIRLWIAEGFIDEKKNNDMTKEEAGELQLHELLWRNMFQMAKMGVDGKSKSCRILRPLQEFAAKRAQQDRFCSRSETGTSLPPERTVHLSLIARESNNDMNIIDKTYQTQLRSLLLLGGENLQASSQMKYFSLSRFKLLCVLDLEGAPIKILPDSVGNLCLLYYLGLRRTNLIELPRSIATLRRLETLDIRDTFTRDLPQDLEQLNKLRHLLLASSFHRNVVNLPVDIASFKDLQTLAGVKLTKKIGENLMELTQLQKLSVGKVKNNLVNQLAISIKSMESLRSLTIKCDWGEQIHASLFESFSKIRTLRVQGKFLDLYIWVRNLKFLTHLDIRDCVLTHDPFLQLGNLSNLVSLSLQNAYVGESILFETGGFNSLKKLSIARFQLLSQWYMDDDALENLEKLTIRSCSKLTHLPPGFRKLANLRVMQVTKMPEAFVKEARQLGKETEKLTVVVLGLSEAQFHSSKISMRKNCIGH